MGTVHGRRDTQSKISSSRYKMIKMITLKIKENKVKKETDDL